MDANHFDAVIHRFAHQGDDLLPVTEVLLPATPLPFDDAG